MHCECVCVCLLKITPHSDSLPVQQRGNRGGTVCRASGWFWHRVDCWAGWFLSWLILLKTLLCFIVFRSSILCFFISALLTCFRPQIFVLLLLPLRLHKPRTHKLFWVLCACYLDFMPPLHGKLQTICFLATDSRDTQVTHIGGVETGNWIGKLVSELNLNGKVNTDHYSLPSTAISAPWEIRLTSSKC